MLTAARTGVVPLMCSAIDAARAAQQRWAAQSTHARVQILRRLRHEIASDAQSLAETVPTHVPGALHRTVADTLVAEVLPLLEACRFLEREAAFVLAPRRESTTSRPIWLGGVSVETRREPLGVILLIAPANYPLFLPGVQLLQALAAGNAVLWKPALAGTSCALALHRLLVACGMDPALFTILSSDPAAATRAIRTGVDKVVLTGSATTGRAVLHELADTLTPATMELSGCDAVFVLDGADLQRATEAITFALRLNGSATCMAPRRLFVTERVSNQLLASLRNSLAALQPVPVPARTRELVQELVSEAALFGAITLMHGNAQTSAPAVTVGVTLLTRVTPEMRIAQADIFAPVLCIMHADNEEAMLAAHRLCPYGLTAAVFGPRKEADAFARRIHAGTVLINDVIVPTADPRATFSGRGKSGFGATRGREGLLEMTAPRTILRQSSHSRRAYQSTSAAHIPFFAGLASAIHARGWRARLAGASRLVRASRGLK